MTKKNLPRIIFACAALTVLMIQPVFADLDQLDLPPEDEYFKAEVLEVLPANDQDGITDPFQKIRVKALEGTQKSKEVIVIQETVKGYRMIQDIEQGETIVVYYSPLSDPPYVLDTKYRLPYVLHIILAFFLLVLAFTGWHGVRALSGLVVSLIIVIYFVVPQIAGGANPIVISLTGALFMLVSAMFLSHGVNTRTTIAFISTVFTLFLSSSVGWLSIHYAKLLGVGSDEAFFLQFGNLGSINLQGLLLGGIIISTIGLLDDVSVVQATAVEEIHKADKTLSKNELYERGLVIGKEHIVSMVNTLFIVYAGAALPLFLFFNFSEHTGIPLWVHINREALTEEIIRSIVGSMVLICTVPATTLLAAHVYSKRTQHE